jgi:hypothetical protein
MKPQEAVQHQLDAYNARNLDRFLAVYADDVKVYRPPAAVPSMDGKAALADFHAKQRFNLPGLRAELLNRIVMGTKVIDHERVSGIRDAPFEVLAVYNVVDGLIRAVWFFAPD